MGVRYSVAFLGFQVKHCPFCFVDTEMILLPDLEEKTIDSKVWRIVGQTEVVLIAPEQRIAQSNTYFCEGCGFVATFVTRRT
jgi:hypothetical protein